MDLKVEVQISERVGLQYRAFDVSVPISLDCLYCQHIVSRISQIFLQRSVNIARDIYNSLNKV